MQAICLRYEAIQAICLRDNAGKMPALRGDTGKLPALRGDQMSPSKPIVTSATDPAASFPIVALGAAAGGLESLKKFFARMPSDSGMGLIVVQHPNPAAKRLLPSTLGKLTPMNVHQAKDGMRIESNHVYVIPPGNPLVLINGAFQSVEHAHGSRHPIDYFFKSLAEARRERAIGVILSGIGGDGAMGLKAINEAGGMTIVQEPEDATYQGMPRRALATGLIDSVLPAGEIPAWLVKCATHPHRHGESALDQNSPALLDFLQKILRFTSRQTGHDFSQYKPNTILRRIKRRMGVHLITDPEQYYHYLQQFPQEATNLVRELLIGVTSFFRDTETFMALKTEVLPYLVEHRQGDEPLRIWVVGCSTGEEAYSLAMLITEYKRETGMDFPVQIFASDINSEAIGKARRCHYPKIVEDCISTERLKLFFRKEGDGYRITKEIRGMVVFAVQDVITDPPFSKIDLISCRNLMIYLQPELQKRILLLFHYALSAEGILLLGSAETVGEFTDLFQPIDKKQKIFRRLDGKAPRLLINFPIAANPSAPSRRKCDRPK